MKKSKKRGRPPKNSIFRLSNELIVDTAKKLYFTDKKLPSIRDISTSLNIDPMAIYHYFPTKASLLDAISLSLMQNIYEPKAGAVLEVELKSLCISYLKLLHNYPNLLEVMLESSSKGPAYIFLKKLLIILKPLSLSSEEFQNALDLLADYLHGFSLTMRCRDKKDNSEFLHLINGPLTLYIDSLKK